MDLLSHERWLEIDACLGSALDVGSGERERLVREIEDVEIRRAVERLLSTEPLGFLEAGAIEFAAPFLPDPADEKYGAIEPPAQIGPYRIDREIGHGGMGTVYRAYHEGLGRWAALKFIPPHLATDDGVRDQFMTEARAAAALDHPSICTVYDVREGEGGRPFIAMAYYEGETLRARLARGPLPVDDAVDIAVRVAEGLAAAHAVGIVHRDVKPANVMLTTEGSVKLLDFGLAKLEGQLFEMGERWGTVSYMSPEQARGGAVDHRTDVWSLGVMLYEMLAGARPFARGHELSVLRSIVHESPEPLTSVRPDAPPALVAVVERALAKDPSERYADMAAVLADLRGVRQDIRLSDAERRNESGRMRWGVPVAVVVIAVLVLAAVFVRSGDSKPPNSSASYLKVTTSGNALLPELSPDGTSIAYVERESETEHRVVMQDVSGGNRIVVLEECYDCWNLRWLPDGSGLSFSALVDPGSGGPANFFVPRRGGELERLDPYTGLFSWSPDGSRYAGASTSDKAIMIVDRATGETVERLELNVPFSWFHGVEWSPTGDRLLFVTHDEERRFSIWTISLDEGNMQNVVEASAEIFSPRWSGRGEGIYYLLDEGTTESVMWVPVDARSNLPAGPAVPVLTGLETDDSFSLSGDGKRLAYARAALSSHLWLLTMARPGTESALSAAPLTTGTSWNECPSISPDGRTVAFHRIVGNTANLFVMPVLGGTPRQITHRKGKNFCPVWSPDGQTLAFGSDEGNGSGLWTVGVREGVVQPLTQIRLRRARLNSPDMAWASRRRALYPGLTSGPFMLDPEKNGQRLIMTDPLQGWGRVLSPRYTPDGERVALWGTAPGFSQTGLWTWNFNLEGGHLPLLLKRSGGVPQMPIDWSVDGEWIFVLERGARETHIEKVHATTGETNMIAVVPEDIRVGLRNADPEVTMSPDGKHFVFAVRQVHASDVMLIENFDPAVR